LPELEVEADDTNDAENVAIERWSDQYGARGIERFTVSIEPSASKSVLSSGFVWPVGARVRVKTVDMYGLEGRGYHPEKRHIGKCGTISVPPLDVLADAQMMDNVSSDWHAVLNSNVDNQVDYVSTGTTINTDEFVVYWVKMDGEQPLWEFANYELELA